MKRINIKCPYCGSQALLRPASVVHKHTVPGGGLRLRAVPACNAYVSAHRNSHLPMGTLADRPCASSGGRRHRPQPALEAGPDDRKEAYAGSRCSWSAGE